MNAKVKIRGIRDPLTVDSEKGKKIRLARFGDGANVQPRNPDSPAVIGTWAGTLGSIEWVEIEKPEVRRSSDVDYDIAVSLENKRLMSLAPKERAVSTISYMCFVYAGVICDYSCQGDPVRSRLVDFAEKYFERCPSACRVPSKILREAIKASGVEIKQGGVFESRALELA